MRFIRGTILFFLFLISFYSVSALDLTQQTNKILMTPFYSSSMSQNINYTYDFSINPPDKISNVLTALISLQVYINPTVTIYAWINGTPCSTPSYTVSTTYASSGQSLMTFDCTNVVNKEGSYRLTVKPTSANTGASTSWIDVTYNNNQSDYVGTVGTVDRVDNVSSVDSVSSVDNVKGIVTSKSSSLSFFGTEYSPGDRATIFLQLKDATGNPVNNGMCYLSMLNPLSNGTHSFFLNNAPMINNNQGFGLYYYDMTVPLTLGVYMLSASCSYTYQNPLWIFSPTDSLKPVRTVISGGDYSGDTIVLNSKEDSLYSLCTSSASPGCIATYTFNLSSYSLVNISALSLYYSGQADTMSKVLTMSYWNGTGYKDLPNTLTYSGTASATTPTSVDDFLTNSIPLSAIIDNLFIVKTSIASAGSGKHFYNNWMSLLAVTQYGNLQDLKGSSEMHITNIANVTTSMISNQMNTSLIYDIWSVTTNRTLTDAGVLWVGGTEYDINESVGKIIVRLIDTKGKPVTSASCNATLMNPDMTVYQNLTFTEITVREGMYYSNFNVPKTVGVYPYGVDCFKGGSNYYLADSFHIRDMSKEVWQVPNTRNLTYYPSQTDMTNYTKVSESVWSWSGDIVTNILDKFTTYIWQAMGGKAEVLT